MQGVFVALVDRDYDPFQCIEHMDTDVECYETWNTVWILEGDTLEEAKKITGRKEISGCLLPCIRL